MTHAGSRCGLWSGETQKQIGSPSKERTGEEDHAEKRDFRVDRGAHTDSLVVRRTDERLCRGRRFAPILGIWRFIREARAMSWLIRGPGTTVHPAVLP